jgi:S-adenosylmethionine-diacylgycerolhomoserine-N-methlytransferase
MGFASDLSVLYHLTCTRVRGDNHGARLEAFYSKQMAAYDDFRKRLLHGREEMMTALAVPDGGRLLDMGGGTGSNLEALGDRLSLLADVRIVDLCASLLQVAEDRIRRHGWTNVRTVQGNATTYDPGAGPVDLVTFSYSLTMIPSWVAAIDRAYTLLKPGGVIGVADFYVAHKWPAPGLRRHSALQRSFWPAWFGLDNVFLSADHLPYLQERFQTLRLEERLGRVPYLLGLKAPYYIFLGIKS